METTFMTIHNLSPHANVLFASSSITDVLGYAPDDVKGRSCFDYFHPDEISRARHVHSNGVQLDKAAVLQYCRIKHRDGHWVRCECVFTIVYDVMVACISVFRGDAKSERRAIEAPTIRRLFTSSPRDPRYQMLEYLSSKFKSDPQAGPREPRAALILNRFTRTLTVLYATNAIAGILGISPEDIKGRSFYEFIQEDCLRAAILCLESAKANDSIAYLRFWSREPESADEADDPADERNPDSDSDEELSIKLEEQMDIDPAHPAARATHQAENRPSGDGPQRQANSFQLPSYLSSIDATSNPGTSTPSSSSRPSQEPREHTRGAPSGREPLEIEAVVSCTSDGLVVILRRARPFIPEAQEQLVAHRMASGVFAAPWGVEPTRPPEHQEHPRSYPRGVASSHPQFYPPVPAATSQSEEFMRSITEVAVFAWSLSGINGDLASYSRGISTRDARLPNGLPIWDRQNHPPHGYPPSGNQPPATWGWTHEKNTKEGDVDDTYQYLCLGSGRLYPSSTYSPTTGPESNPYQATGHNGANVPRRYDEYSYQQQEKAESEKEAGGDWNNDSPDLDMTDKSPLSGRPR